MAPPILDVLGPEDTIITEAPQKVNNLSDVRQLPEDLALYADLPVSLIFLVDSWEMESDGSARSVKTCTAEADVAKELEDLYVDDSGDPSVSIVPDAQIDGMEVTEEELRLSDRVQSKWEALPGLLSSFRRLLPEMHADLELGPIPYCELSRRRSSVDLQRICEHELNLHDGIILRGSKDGAPERTLQGDRDAHESVLVRSAPGEATVAINSRTPLPTAPLKKMEPRMMESNMQLSKLRSKTANSVDSPLPEARGFIRTNTGAAGPGAHDPPRKVARHSSRGSDLPSRKEIRDAEDRACNAGMRNPYNVCTRWPSLIDAMKPVRRALTQACEDFPELHDLPLAVGAEPVKQPPSEEAVLHARCLVGKALGLTKDI